MMPPGLSERTTGKDVISTSPKDTDRLPMVAHVSTVPRDKDRRSSVQIFCDKVGRRLEVMLHSVRLVLPVSPPLLVSAESLKQPWPMTLLLWGETDGIVSPDLMHASFMLRPIDRAMIPSPLGLLRLPSGDG
jgi:hypothetical protein